MHGHSFEKKKRKKEMNRSLAPTLLIPCPKPESMALNPLCFSSFCCVLWTDTFIHTISNVSTLDMTYWFPDLIYRVFLKLYNHNSSLSNSPAFIPLYIITVTLSNILKSLFPATWIADRMIASPFCHSISRLYTLHSYQVLTMLPYHSDHNQDFCTVILGWFQF